jgi:general secretion pathway protein D
LRLAKTERSLTADKKRFQQITELFTMKKIAQIICMFCFVSISHAKPLALNFNKVDLNVFLEATFADILKKNFVIAPDLLTQGRKISLRVMIEDDKLAGFLKTFLEQFNIVQTDLNGIIYLAPKPMNLASNTQALDSSVVPINSISPTSLIQLSQQQPQYFQQQNLALHVAEKKTNTFYKPKARTPEFLCALVSSISKQSICYPAGTSIVLSLTEEQHLPVLDLLKEIDRTMPRVKISATFLEVSSSIKDGFGLSITADILGKTLGLNFGLASATGAISLKGGSLNAVLDALKTDGRFKQVASPSGFVNAGEHYVINIGDDVPTLGNLQQDSKGSAVQSIQYRPSGVLLDVLPKVIESETNKIEATIKAQVSSFTPTLNGVNNSPTLTKREINTVLNMDDNEILVLGGLTSTKSSSTQSKLFGIIPWSYSNQLESTELLLILTMKTTK